MSDPTVNLTFSVYEFGCLRGVLEHEIANVERAQRVVGVNCGPAERDMTDAYLRQLRAALGTVMTVYDGIGAT